MRLLCDVLVVLCVLCVVRLLCVECCAMSDFRVAGFVSGVLCVCPAMCLSHSA